MMTEDGDLIDLDSTGRTLAGTSAPVDIVAFTDDHIEDAAVLVAARYRSERKLEQSLPPQFEDPTAVAHRLKRYANGRAGVAAVRTGRLDGFLIGLMSPIRGVGTAWSPDWGHAADETDGRDIYRAMYATLAPRWLANGCFDHAVTMSAHDTMAADAWYSLGFGMTTVDALRGLDPLPRPAVDVQIRRATVDDMDQLVRLQLGLQRHVASAPTFMPLLGSRGVRFQKEWLSKPRNVLWLALHDDAAVASMRLEPSHQAVLPTSSDSTVAITTAITRQDLRLRGIGTALLNHSLEWARSAGYTDCSVDFESANIPGTRFWYGKGFRPVCYSLVRHVDERIAWAHRDRDEEDVLRELQS